MYVCFVWVEALCPNQHFFSHVGTFSSAKPVLSNEDEVFAQRHNITPLVSFKTLNLAIKSGTLPTELTVLDWKP